jgi:hypothetical protein
MRSEIRKAVKVSERPCLDIDTTTTTTTTECASTFSISLLAIRQTYVPKLFFLQNHLTY